MIGTLLVILGGLALVSVAWSAVEGWLDANRTPTTAYAEILKKRLTSGKYRVVAGVFDRHGHRTAQTEWEADELGDDLKRRFGNENRIIV
jgi:hypothetical protein